MSDVKMIGRNTPRPSRTALVEMPEWGGSVLIRELPLSYFDSQSTDKQDEKAQIEDAISAIMYSVIDHEDKQPLFASPEDVRALGLPTIKRLSDAIGQLGALKPADAAAIAKN